MIGLKTQATDVGRRDAWVTMSDEAEEQPQTQKTREGREQAAALDRVTDLVMLCSWAVFQNRVQVAQLQNFKSQVPEKQLDENKVRKVRSSSGARVLLSNFHQLRRDLKSVDRLCWTLPPPKRQEKKLSDEGETFCNKTFCFSKFCNVPKISRLDISDNVTKDISFLLQEETSVHTKLYYLLSETTHARIFKYGLPSVLDSDMHYRVNYRYHREKELAAVKINYEDIEIIANEVEVDKRSAERRLREHDGNLVNALKSYL